MLTLRALPAFIDNYIWTLATPQGYGLVVDPGDAQPVIRAVAEGLQPVAILLTHHHADHIGGVDELLSRYDIPCYAPHDERIPQATHRVGEGDFLEIAALGITFNVIALPGHTRSHIAFYGQNYLFCGDTLFSLGCGRLFEGTPAQMLSSLDLLSTLPDATWVCCGHEYTINNGRFAQLVEPGNLARDQRLDEALSLRACGLPSVPSTLANERACNPFLRIDQPSIRQQLQARASTPLDRIQAFSAMREWKNGFHT